MFVDRLAQKATSVRVDLVFENPGDDLLQVAWLGDFGDRTYLLDDGGQKCPLEGRDSEGFVWRSGYGPQELPAGAKVRSQLAFTCKQTPAPPFTLISTEGKPKPNRAVVLRSLRPL